MNIIDILQISLLLIIRWYDNTAAKPTSDCRKSYTGNATVIVSIGSLAYNIEENGIQIENRRINKPMVLKVYAMP